MLGEQNFEKSYVRLDATEREIVFPFQSCGDVEFDADGLSNNINVNVEEAQGGA